MIEKIGNLYVQTGKRNEKSIFLFGKRKTKMIKSKIRLCFSVIRLLGIIRLMYFCFKEFSSIFLEKGLILGELLISGFIGSMGVLNLVFLLGNYEVEITEKELVKKFLFGFFNRVIEHIYIDKEIK